jgi:hypothetical protein
MRVHAHRGNTLAAGAVVLSAAVVEAELRPGPSVAVRAALALGLAALAAFGALRSPREEDPRAYQEVLLTVAALAGTAGAAHVLALAGAGPGEPLRAWWVAAVAAVGAVLGLGLARARAGAIVLGVGALAATVALVAGAGAAWPGEDPRDGVRLALLLAALVLVVAIVMRIDRRYRQAVALADVLAVVVILGAATFLVDGVPGAAAALGLPDAPGRAGLGAQLLLLVAGFSLAGLGATLHERGPGGLGALALLASLGVLARGGGGLGGWPVVLGLVGLGIVAVALRPLAFPRPEEDGPDPPAPVVPLRRRPALVPAARERDPDDELL